MELDAKWWLDLVQSVAMAAITIWMWTATRRAAQKRDVDEKLATLHDRVTVAEQRIAHGPNHEDLERIHHRLDNVSENLSRIAGEFKAVRRQLELINQHLLERAG